MRIPERREVCNRFLDLGISKISKASPFIIPQIKRYPSPRPSLPIPYFHLLQLVFPLDFLKFSGIESFYNFTTRVVGIGMEDSMR